MLFSCSVVSPKSLSFSIQNFWYFFFWGGCPIVLCFFLRPVLPLCNLVSRMMKANSMIHLLLQMSEEREVAEGRLRTLGALAVRRWELLLRVCLGRASLQQPLLQGVFTICCGEGRHVVIHFHMPKATSLWMSAGFLFPSQEPDNQAGVSADCPFSSLHKGKARSQSLSWFLSARRWRYLPTHRKTSASAPTGLSSLQLC